MRRKKTGRKEKGFVSDRNTKLQRQEEAPVKEAGKSTDTVCALACV